MRTRITNVTLMPGAEGGKHLSFIPNAEVQVNGNVIAYAGRSDGAPAFEADELIDGRGMLLMPGLSNMHTHTPMTVMRGIGSDLSLERWLQESIFPTEKHLTDECVRASMDLGVMEMLRFGTTAFNDMYMHMDEIAGSVMDTGIRAMLGYCVVDFDESLRDIQPGVEFIEKWMGKSERMHINIAPHSEVTTTPKALLEMQRMADELNIPLHIHVSETRLDRDGSLERRGLTPPRYLEKLGILKSKVIAAHCVWLDDEEIELFAKRGVTVVHNPVSNLKLASGIAPISKMLDAGINVTLGTDGVASNNNLNLWEELKLMPLLQKGTTLDPNVVTPAQTIAAATINGARAMQFDKLGLIREGWLADLILVDSSAIHMTPENDAEANLVYSALGSDVRLTMVDGKVLYRDGEFTTMDERLVLARARREAELLFERVERHAAEKK